MLSVTGDTSAPFSYIGYVTKKGFSAVEFPQQLAALRQQHGLTQQQLAERIGIRVVQLRRYEAGPSGKDERGPDDKLRLQFEAVSRFDPEEKQGVRSLLDGIILKNGTRRWQTVSNGGKRK
jgi:DNA-binding XRE family transcriptional regulator